MTRVGSQGHSEKNKKKKNSINFILKIIYISQYVPTNFDLKHCQMIYHKYYGSAELQGKNRVSKQQIYGWLDESLKTGTPLSLQELGKNNGKFSSPRPSCWKSELYKNTDNRKHLHIIK